MEEKIYCGNAKKIDFQNGGSIVKVKLGPSDLQKINEWAQNNGGWCNLNVSERRSVSDKGYTHSVSVDQWKPDVQQSGGYQPTPQPTQQAQNVQSIFSDGSDIPF